MSEEDVPFTSSPPPYETSTERPRKQQRRPGGPIIRDSAIHDPPQPAERAYRIVLVQTGGRLVHVWDRDVVAVKEVSTTKHGDCLIAEIRGGEPLWLIDDPSNRSALSVRRSRGTQP